ncbi:MAG: TetR/AcrR family transcriptional regulator [Saprospiraceae bacterium]|nr:TetR/AcrR family transcriptional regulator [Saprospiraceae bacterium]
MDQKSALLASAKELFLSYGVKSVSMDDIARMLGISKKTVYTFVENKKELVVSVIQHFIEEEHAIVEDIRETSENAIHEMMSIARYVLESVRTIKPSLSYDLKKYHPAAWKLIDKDHFSHIQNVIKSNIERGIKEGFYREEIDIDIYSRLYIGLARMIFNPDSFETREYQLPDLYQNVMDYHIHGIMNDKGRKTFNKYLKNIEA